MAPGRTLLGEGGHGHLPWLWGLPHPPGGLLHPPAAPSDPACTPSFSHRAPLRTVNPKHRGAGHGPMGLGDAGGAPAPLIPYPAPPPWAVGVRPRCPQSMLALAERELLRVWAEAEMSSCSTGLW